MKLPWWYTKVWKEGFGKALILGALVVFPLLSVGTYFYDPSYSWWQAWAFGWSFSIALILIFYWQRNTK